MGRNSEDQETEYITVEEVKAETPKAILCLFETGDEFWIPKSQIRDDSEVTTRGDKGELAIPRWLAKEKELI
jgi:hypothetical protein